MRRLRLAACLGVVALYWLAKVEYSETAGNEDLVVSSVDVGVVANSMQSQRGDTVTNRSVPFVAPRLVLMNGLEEESHFPFRDGIELKVEVIPQRGGTMLYNPWFHQDDPQFSSWYIEIIRPDGQVRNSMAQRDPLPRVVRGRPLGQKYWIWIPDTARIVSNVKIQPSLLGKPALSGTYKIKLCVLDRFCSRSVVEFNGEEQDVGMARQRWRAAYPGRVIASSNEVVIEVP